MYIAINSIACNERKEESQEYNKIENFNDLIKERAKTHILILEYNSADEILLNSKNFKKLALWVDSFEQDSILKTLPIDELENSFIIHIQGIVNTNIHKDITINRMKDIEDSISKRLGKKEYDIPVYKVLNSLLKGDYSDNYIKISVNRLIY